MRDSVSISISAEDALEIMDAIAFIIEADPRLSESINESGAFSRLAVALDDNLLER